jgi:hypothetical protein
VAFTARAYRQACETLASPYLIGESDGAHCLSQENLLMTHDPDKPVSVAYYYRIKWGYQDEFLELFKRNHYPILQAQIDSGRLVRVEVYTPRFHGDGRSDWNFMTVLVFRNWQALDESESSAVAKTLYPDQEKFKREEQRRFELVEAHWDVPLNAVSL